MSEKTYSDYQNRDLELSMQRSSLERGLATMERFNQFSTEELRPHRERLQNLQKEITANRDAWHAFCKWNRIAESNIPGY
jgi:predicted  nucleic acid-binding Zn-ribbon protein